MQKAVLVARLLLGAIFVIFSANYVFHFLPMPQPNEAAGAYLGALAASGFVFPVIKAIEFVSGLMLLAGRGVPLALTLLAPIVINIFFYHVMLDSSGMPMAVALLALNVFLAWAYRGSFRGVLDFSAKPTT